MKTTKFFKLPVIAFFSIALLTSCNDGKKKADNLDSESENTELYGENTMNNKKIPASASTDYSTEKVESEKVVTNNSSLIPSSTEVTTYDTNSIASDDIWSKSSDLYSDLELTEEQTSKFKEYQVWEMNHRHVHDNNEKKMHMKDYDERLKSFLTDAQYTKYKAWEKDNMSTDK